MKYLRLDKIFRSRTTFGTVIIVVLTLIMWFGTRQSLPNGLLQHLYENQVLSNTYYVSQVFDGDTIEVIMNNKRETVRLIGVDTPETRDPRKAVQCYGKAASNFTKSQLYESFVRLESDPLSTNRDRYDRLLRYVYKNDQLHNSEIIAQGYGFANTGFPFTKIEEFKSLQRTAEAQNNGLWGQCNISELSSGQLQTNDSD